MSNPAPAPPANPAPPVNPPAIPAAPVAGTLTALDASKPRITTHTISTAKWPDDLTLDLHTHNWRKWDRQIESTLALAGGGMYRYPRGTIPVPDITIEPRATENWHNNDFAVLHLIKTTISDVERDLVDHFTTSKLAYDFLSARHQKQGIFPQILLLQEALALRYSRATPYPEMTSRFRDYTTRICAMGPLTNEHLMCVLMLTGLSSPELQYLRDQIHIQSGNNQITAEEVEKCLQSAETMRTMDSGPVVLPSGTTTGSTAFTAMPSSAAAASARSSQNPNTRRTVCSNCKRTNHLPAFCIAPGGGMEGKTLDDARNAQRVARGKSPSSSASTSPSTTSYSGRAFTTPNGQQAFLADNGTVYTASSPLPSAPITTFCPPVHGGDFANLAVDNMPMAPGDHFEHAAWIIDTPIGHDIPTTLSVSVDWSSNSRAVETVNLSAVDTSKRLPLSLKDSPFFLDTGATTHLSPERTDFHNLRPISPRPITGVGGIKIEAVGVGTIRLSVGRGIRLVLEDVLYVPAATVRLVSVLALNRRDCLTTHFDDSSCWITNPAGAVVARGLVGGHRRLYRLSLSNVATEHQALAASHPLPTLTTWHNRLGHANYRTIIDMTKSAAADGMPVDLSLTPPTCEHCILGKQVRTHVPSIREGERAKKRLEKVHVDLCGPMPITSRSGYRYSMHLIDDYSNYPWSIPLKAKSDAFSRLQAWELSVEAQTGEHVGIYVTDNGELKSTAMKAWCDSRGTEHQLTAPYVSAQNGKCERLHLTLMNKARSMSIACHAPPSFWDEFISTAAYLSTLTPSSSINNRTPYELWFGRKPNLSHLREIGCAAYVLFETHTSKIGPRSYRCTLIGYEPHAKAYRCWHSPSNRIITSYNVSFIESQGTSPTPLHPGRTIPSSNSTPTWEIPSSSSSVPSIPADPFYDNVDNHNDDDDDDDNPPPPPATSTPSLLPLTDPPAAPPLRRSTRTRFPTSRATTSDGLHHSAALRQALVDSAAAAARQEEQRELTRLAAAEQSTSNVELSNVLLNPPPPQPFSVNADHDALAELSAALPPTDRLLLAEFIANLDDIPTAQELAPVDVECPDDPKTWREAMASLDSREWVNGAEEELTSLREHQVFKLVPRDSVPHGRKILQGRFVCRRKRNEHGIVTRHKVRFVAKGYEQIYGQDFTKTTAPTARLESFRALLHIAAAQDWDAQQFDVKTAFLNGVLPDDEIQFMEQPEGFAELGKESWVWELHKGLYGMRQSGRIWNKQMHEAMLTWGFTRLACEWCVYHRHTDKGVVIAAIHVDDILSIANTPEENERFKSQLRAKWTISDLGDVKFALGIGIVRNRQMHTVALNQTALIDRIVTQFRQNDAHSVSTPMDRGIVLRRPHPGIKLSITTSQFLARLPYRSLVGCLMYVALGTRPDIAYAVSRLSCFLDCYRIEHWHAAVRVIRYLKGTRTLPLILGGDSIELMGFTDSDYANDLDTRKSVGGYGFTLGSGMISWSSRKQRTVADSSTAAEYIAASEASRECVWLRALLHGIGITQTKPTPIFCDNNSTIDLSQDQLFHARVKHIDVRWHYLRERVENADLVLSRIRGVDNTADVFTKPLSPLIFNRLRNFLGLRSLA